MIKSCYETKEIYTIEQVLSKVVPYKGEDIIEVFDGDEIDMTSQRYYTFKYKGTVCCKCGLQAQFFAKEKTKKQEAKRYHFNLYAIKEDGTEIQFTKDHVIPKSKGGKNHLSNYQTMCVVCNKEKGNKLEV